MWLITVGRRVVDWGPSGRWFKSSRPDYLLGIALQNPAGGRSVLERQGSSEVGSLGRRTPVWNRVLFSMRLAVLIIGLVLMLLLGVQSCTVSVGGEVLEERATAEGGALGMAMALLSS
jgi:hypothetical protein